MECTCSSAGATLASGVLHTASPEAFEHAPAAARSPATTTVASRPDQAAARKEGIAARGFAQQRAETNAT
eukprot:CAMPEP_0183387782 /NCGR_PEP_ID=MMETSP0370-20130417/3543_1 /TAXON_ID=268820 /ORGANISM="Peridinium aciculiferum, Strain PAER-2" /LENGTH=69 /DNA_ID=CAMNT_0025566499 /DNA_START=194 /DNA_END=403 /DNA_ORIENTATION=-